MPTPVSTARQYLTDEAARVLDEAVNVARRRTHAQTTSLHAVSALLAPPSSLLREACARARSCAYSQRLQFRALELTVGVPRPPAHHQIPRRPADFQLAHGRNQAIAGESAAAPGHFPPVPALAEPVSVFVSPDFDSQSRAEAICAIHPG